MTESRCYYYHFRHSPSELSKRLSFYIHALGWVAYPRKFPTVRKANSFYGYQLQYVNRGKGYFIWEGTKHHVGPDDLLFIDLTQEHAYYPDPEDPWELLWIHFGGEQARVYLTFLEHRKTPVIRLEKNEQFKQWCQDLIYLFSFKPVGLELMANSAITRMLTEISVASMSGASENDGSRPSNYVKYINDAIVYITNHYSNPITLKEIADSAKLSTFYFARMFKQCTGFTVKEYLLKFRLTEAKRLLANTSLPICEIARQVGFSSQSHLGEMFKKYENITPNRYRKNQKERI